MLVASQGTAAFIFGLLGLLIGSFLNVVIYRLPLTMYRSWLLEASEIFLTKENELSLWEQVCGPNTPIPLQLQRAAMEAKSILDLLPQLNLSKPRSRCNHCGHQLTWFENVPILSFLALGGRCSVCKEKISLRYPSIELTTGLLFALCGWRYGVTVIGLLWATYVALLVCQFMIDLDTQYLPDTLNYALIWLGLLGALLGLTRVPLNLAVWGTIIGYVSLWVVSYGYKQLTGKMGMGNGDFKLLAALGAWLGSDYLIGIILLSSMSGALIGCAMLVSGKLAHKNIPISFGPYLAGAGLLCFAFSPETVSRMLPFAFPFNVR